MDRIDAAVILFGQDVLTIGEIGVITKPAPHRIIPAAAAKGVGTRLAV